MRTSCKSCCGKIEVSNAFLQCTSCHMRSDIPSRPLWNLSKIFVVIRESSAKVVLQTKTTETDDGWPTSEYNMILLYIYNIITVYPKPVNDDRGGLAYLPNRYVNPLHTELCDVAGWPAVMPGTAIGGKNKKYFQNHHHSLLLSLLLFFFSLGGDSCRFVLNPYYTV